LLGIVVAVIFVLLIFLAGWWANNLKRGAERKFNLNLLGKYDDEEEDEEETEMTTIRKFTPKIADSYQRKIINSLQKELVELKAREAQLEFELKDSKNETLAYQQLTDVLQQEIKEMTNTRNTTANNIDTALKNISNFFDHLRSEIDKAEKTAIRDLYNNSQSDENKNIFRMFQKQKEA
jgi:flagellar motility protein MotE (MotC chaperone)